MRFKVNQQLICIKNGTWSTIEPSNTAIIHPKFNEIVTCIGYLDNEFLYLEGYPRYNGRMPSFWENNFEPIITDELLEKLLESISEPSLVS